MELLKNFYFDARTRDAVRQMLDEQMKEIAVKNSFSGKSVAGIPDAIKAIDEAFKWLEMTFAEKKKAKKPVNEAR